MKGPRFYLKAAAAAALIAALGAGAALVAVKVFFPEPRARAWFVDAARRQLGRDVRLERIDVGLRGLTLHGLEISERTGFPAGTFLRVQDFRLRPSWRALLKRKLVVAAVSADGLKVRVVKGADGRFNYETLASSAAAPTSAATAKPGEAGAPELDVRRAAVSNGTVEYSDAAGASWTLTALDLDVSDFGRGEPFGLSTSFQLRGTAGTRPVDARISFDGRLDLGRGGPARFKAAVKRLVVEQDGLKLTASGKAARLDAPELEFDATLSAGGRELLRATGTAKAGAAAQADVKWKSSALDTALLAKFAPQAGIPALSLPAAEGVLAGTFSADASDVKSFRAAWAGGKIEGSGSARGLTGAKPAYEGHAAFGFDSPEIRPGQYPFLKLPPQLGLPAARVDGEAALKGADLTIASLTAKAKEGTVSLSGSARGLGSAKPVYEGRASFGVDAPEIRPGQYPFLNLPPKLALPAARLDGEVSLKADELKISSLTAKTKQGTVSLSGSVRGVESAKPVPELAAALALDLPAFKVSELPVAVPGVPGSFAVPAGRLEGAVRAAGDDVSFGNLSFKAKGASISVDGKVARALAGTPEPDVAVTADLTLPALTDKDLPFPGVPPGLSMPPSHWTADAGYSLRLIKVKSLRLVTGRNDVEVAGSVTDPSGRGAYDLLFKCRSFALEELTQLTPATRGLKLAGSGFFALSVTGVKDKPVYSGKLQFKGLGATVADLPLADFTGTMTIDANRLDIPNLAGKLADGLLKMDLTVKNYALAPDVELEAELDRFDLGRYLAAKTKLTAERTAAQAAKPAKPGAAEAKPALMSTRGHLNVGTLIHPNATVNDVKVGWDLRGLGADLRGLNGDAKLHVGAGKLVKVQDMALQSKFVKVLIFPILVVQKILHFDFNDITLRQITGDYGFQNGLMSLRQSEMDSDAMQASAKGTIDLPTEALDLLVTTQLGNIAPVDTAVTGTLDHLKSKVNVGKFLLQTLGLKKDE